MPFFTGVGQQIDPVNGPISGAVSGGGQAGMLRIDPEQVDGAIAVFREALADVENEVRVAKAEIRALPPANDQVSTDVADAFNRVSYVNSDSAVAAWEGAVQQLRSIIEQLEAAKRTNVTADTDNSGMLQSPA